jgi:hypothetical protein
MPGNWEYILFAYIWTWIVLLGYLGWLWRTHRTLTAEVAQRVRAKDKGA